MKKVVIPILFFLLFTTLIFPVGKSMHQTFEYNVDEGMDLMATSLFLKGFPLYERIWNDQPPLFYPLLGLWLKFFGSSVFYTRVFILFFSLMLLWAFYKIIEIEWGRLAAFIGVIGLLFSSLYLHLSTSVLLGTVSLSFAMFSVYFIKVYRKIDLKRFLILSAMFIALSISVKLFTAFLIPLLILEIIFANKERNRPLFSHTHLFLGSLILVFFSLISYFFHSDFKMFFQQLILPHFNLKSWFLGSIDTLLWTILLKDYDVVLLALTGIVLLILKKKWRLSFPLLWFILIGIILTFYSDINYHHYPLISIPLCWLAGMGVKELLNFRKNYLIFGLTLALMGLFIFRLPIKFTGTINNVKGYTSPEHSQVLNLLLKYRPITQWMFTDIPIFAFYTNICVPPELAIMTSKRGFQDDKMQIYLKNTLQRYNPELILLNVMEFYGPEVISYIKKKYTLIYQNEIPVWNWTKGLWKTEKSNSLMLLYLRKDIVKDED